MSFMEGFGQAFSQTYNRTAERTEQRKDDIFKLSYNRYLDRLGKKEEQEKKDRTYSANAKALAARYKQPVGPILDALRNGTDASIVEDMAKNGSWVAQEAPSAVEAPESPELQSSAEKQMGGGAMGTPSPDAPQNPGDEFQQRNTNAAYEKIAGLEGTDVASVRSTMSGPIEPSYESSGNYSYTPKDPATSGDFDKAAIQGQHQRLIIEAQSGNPEAVEKLKAFEEGPLAAARIAEAAFDVPKEQKLPSSKEELAAMVTDARNSGDPAKIKFAEDTMQTYFEIQEQEALMKGEFGQGTEAILFGPDGTVKGAGVVTRVDGQTIDARTGQPVEGRILPLTDSMKQLRRDANAAKQDKNVVAYNTQLQQTTGAIRLANDLNTMVQNDDSVLASTVSNTAQIANTAVKEISTALKLFEDPNSITGPIMSGDDVEKVERRVNELMTQPITDLASKRALYEAKFLLFVYRAGQLEGQEGRDLTAGDITNLKQILSASTSKEDFENNIMSYTQTLLDRADDQYVSVEGFNAPNDQLRTETGWAPYDKVAPKLDEFIDKLEDPKLTEGYKKIRSFTPKIRGAAPSSQRQPTPAQTTTEPRRTRSGVSWSIEQ